VQKAVDDVRAEGADYVYLIAHLGNEAVSHPWNYVDVISNTEGIDVVLDGHSHDTEQIVMKNKAGKDVVRSAVGTKLNTIGYSNITDAGIVKTDIISWNAPEPASQVFGYDNDISELVSSKLAGVNEKLSVVLGESKVDLTINDPVEKDLNGKPLRMVRMGETNMGDFVADAIRDQLGADIGMINGGGVRGNIARGKITNGSFFNVTPNGGGLCTIKAKGQSIVDALEFGAHIVPEEFGGIIQVSGMSYEIHTYIDDPCIIDENGYLTGIKGERRVKNVMVGDEPIDLDKEYLVAGATYVLIQNGDGQTAFDDAELVEQPDLIDFQCTVDYVSKTLGGTIGEEYEDPYGQGRIKIVDSK
nr:5'-nucleotidase C-terminal domain-containing protein [Lachnospiraceae bacterium]